MATGITENWSAWQVLNQLFALKPIDNTSASAALSGSTTDAAFRSLIYYFNGGILMAVIAIYAFILVIGTINTAKDGTFLGKNWSSYWIPLRVIMGSTAAIPLKSGFCLAQYLIFLMVSVSIQFANHVWQGTYEMLDKDKVPPVMSYDIADGVKTDIALYLLAGFSADMLKKLAQSAGGDKYDAYDTPKLDQMSVVQAAMKIETNITQQMIDDGQLDDIYVVKDDKSKATINTGNIERLKQGMRQWSLIDEDEDDYVQYDIYKIINHYVFRLPVDQPNQGGVSGALGKYCENEDLKLRSCQNMIASIMDIYNNSQGIDQHLPESATKLKDADLIATLSQEIAKEFQNKLKKAAKNPDPGSSKTDKEKKKPENDWWNADQKYFKLDGNFEDVLKAFHNDFAIFDDLLYNNQQSQISIAKVGVTLQYLESRNSLNSLVDHAISGSLKYSIYPDTSADEKNPQHSKEVKLTDFTEKDQIDKFIQLDLSQLKQQMVDVFHNVYGDKDDQYCKDEFSKLFLDQHIIKGFSCKDLIDAVVPSSISSDIGKYFLVIQTALTNSQSGIKASLKLSYVTQFLALVRLFQLNGVGFFHEGAVVADIASPAESFVNDIFQKMSLDASAGGVLSQIYNIGESVSPGAEMTNAFSALRQVQGVGQSLIKMVVDTLKAITKKADDALRDVRIEVGVIQGVSKGAALGAAAFSYFTPGLPGVISSIGDFGAQLATFITMTNLTMSLIWLPLVFFVLVTLFTNAVLFALVIPMTPFILFWAGKIAWLLLIIEALVAAPVVALGLVYPEGHEVYGKAEPAIQIMLNLVLRPVLMICGLITGIILTYLVIAISAKGFHAVATQISNVYGTSSDSYVTGSLNILLVFMYASFISLAFYKCFSLIYILPDKILHWVGGTHNERAGEQDMQEMKSSTVQHAQGMAQAGTQTVEKHNQGRQEQMHGVQNLGSSAGHVASAVDNYKYHKSQKGGGGKGGNGAHLNNPVNPNNNKP